VEDFTAGEILTLVFICLGVVGGAAYGWLAAGNVLAAFGGAVIIGTASLTLVIVVALGVHGLGRLFGRRGDR
jgi:hypothetical protein